ncbi:MAG: inositol monophosphatase [Alphaproteobacteria bacterium]|nr:inositol monophosphatase [Alphaproteobacteria bacterium]
MTSLDLDARFAAGRLVTHAAGRAAKGFFDRRRELAVELKGPQDVVSMADRDVERLIVDGLRAQFPQDAFLGEEYGHQGAGGVTWVIDPIDGTANFMRGVAFWCVSVGLLVDNRPVLGFVYDPIQDEMFAAAEGRGARCNDRVATVSAAGPGRGRINLGFNIRQSRRRFVPVLERLVDQGCEFSRYGSSALSLAYVADGRLEGFWESKINAWDVCAGLVLAHEAGAIVDDFFEGRGPARVNSVFAATPALEATLRWAVSP